MLQLIRCCLGSSTWSRPRNAQASTTSKAVTETSSQHRTASRIWEMAPDEAEQALQRLANATRQHKSQQDRDLQLAAAEVVKRIPLLEPHDLLAGRHEALLAAQEAQDEVAVRLHDLVLTLSEQQAALAHAHQAAEANIQAKSAALAKREADLEYWEGSLAHQEKHSAQAIQELMMERKTAHQEKAILQHRLATASQELQIIRVAQAAAAAQPILPELSWGVARSAIGGSDPIAAGAHGTVYACPLAIKVASGDYRWCLEEEAQATAHIDHPNICKPLFLSRHGDLLAMGMPLAQLGSLSSYLRGDTNEPTLKGFLRLPFSSQIRLLLQLAEALQECHTTRHVVHMDVKADNILMLGPGHLQLTDFGCVRNLVDATAFIDLSTEEFSYHPFLCPVSATDEVHAGVRDDIWGFFTTAAALLTPVSPFQRVYDRFSRMPAAAKEKLCERLEQAGIHLEQASHAWYQFLHLQHTDEDYSIRQEFSPAEIRAVFEDTHFPLLEDYLTFISDGLNLDNYQGGYRAHADPEFAWADICEQLEGFQQLAGVLEDLKGILPEQAPLYGKFALSPEGRTLHLLP